MGVPRDVPAFDPATAYARRDEFRWVDVRETYEYADGHVEGSELVVLQDLPGSIEEFETSQPLVFVCHLGQRSAMATAFMRDRGFEAYNLIGGLEAWEAAGLPLVTPGP